MAEPTKLTAQTLAALGVSAPEQVTRLFADLRAQFDREAAAAEDEAAWRAFRDAWLGRKSGRLSQISDHWLKPASPELKRAVGAALNELRGHVEAAIAARHAEVESAEEQASLARDRADLSLPGVTRALGGPHILRQTIAELERIFLGLGFTVVEGPEIETPYYNFEALNIPENHPARESMDTLYLEPATPGLFRPGDLLLRTHTSPMQVRTMEKQAPPVRIIVPGKVYRRDNPDATHSFMFTQIEGLAVDHDITFCEFKGTMEHVLREFFGPQVRTRLQPSYFPFTEPSADVFGSCFLCEGRGCRLCKNSGWIELLGAGMVDPAVYGFVKYDARKLSGFAFGIGVERFAMLKYGIGDIQMFFQNDVRFLSQFV
jgi:phenylalanyl-tRNA synthetase alpha chain